MNIILSAEQPSLLTAFVAFVFIMSIVGFFVMRADKKRWLLQVARSEEMERARKGKKKKAEGEEAEEDAEGKKGKKEKKKKNKKIPEGYVDGANLKSDPYQYKGLIPDAVLFFFAVAFGAFGEMLAMIFYKHRWYKWSFRIFIPACVVLNIVLAVLFGFLLSGKSLTPTTLTN